MPAFVRTKSDEARWKRAKDAVSSSRSKDESSFQDQDWALVNSIYHKMHKSDLLNQLMEQLSKREDDEDDEQHEIQDHGDDEEDEGEDFETAPGMRTFDPDDEEQSDDADAWLAENDPERQAQGETQSAPQEEVSAERDISPSGYSDWRPGEYHQEHQAAIKDLMGQGYSHREAARIAGAHSEPISFQDALSHPVRPSEMSPKFLSELKELASHWITNADKHARLTADKEKNPMKYASGRMMQAHEEHTKDYNKAYSDFLNSDQVKGLKGMDRHKAIQNWKNEWKAGNPEYTQNLTNITQQGQQHHGEAIQRHGAGLDEKLKHVLSGGAHDPHQSFSMQEAAQHAGGTKGEEGYSAPTVQDPAAAFAHQKRQALDKLRGMMQPEQHERLKMLESARQAHGVNKPKTIRRPGGGKI